MKVSVLVPIYGVERYIERCARSLFEQTYTNLEYVFVNDCTPDLSVEILKNTRDEYPEKAPVTKIINHEKNRGLAACRNTALDNATGEFVVFVDSDDWLELDAIELLIKKQEETGADIVSGNRIVHYEKEESLLEEKRYDGQEEMTLHMMRRSWDHFITGRLFVANLFVENGLRWNEGLNLAEDRYMMTLLAYYAKSFANIDEVVYHYERRNEGSITGSGAGKKVVRNNAQELGNLLALEQFFEDKEQVFRDECARCVVEQMSFNLKVMLKYSYKEEFHNVVTLLDTRSDEDLDIIGWNKTGIKGLFQHNYTYMKMKWLKDKCVGFIKRRWNVLLNR